MFHPPAWDDAARAIRGARSPWNGESSPLRQRAGEGSPWQVRRLGHLELISPSRPFPFHTPPPATSPPLLFGDELLYKRKLDRPCPSSESESQSSLHASTLTTVTSISPSRGPASPLRLTAPGAESPLTGPCEKISRLRIYRPCAKFG